MPYYVRDCVRKVNIALAEVIPVHLEGLREGGEPGAEWVEV